MANTQVAGFIPARQTGGGNISYVRRSATSNNTDEIATNDAVKADSGGNILGLGTSSTHATAVDGVCGGVSYIDATQGRIQAKRLPAATTYTGTAYGNENATFVFVTENALNTQFIASIDSAMALTNLRNSFEIVLGAAVNGYSVQELKGSTSAVTATLPFRLIESVLAGDNDISIADARHYVMINDGQTEPGFAELGL
jgi:hypothetical protein